MVERPRDCGTDGCAAAHRRGAERQRFRRQESRFRDWVGRRPAPGRASELPVEPGRYHLYVSLACPWCHRTAIVRELAGLREAVAISYAGALPRRARLGLHRRALRCHRRRRRLEREYVDQPARLGVHVRGLSPERPRLPGRITVPVLWDTRSGHGSSTTSRATSSACSPIRTRSGRWARRRLDLYPAGAGGGDRRDQRAGLRHGQQWRLPRRLRAPPGRLRAGVPGALREPRVARGAARRSGATWPASRSPRPTGACFRRSCASTRSTTCTSVATAGGSSSTRTSGATRASSISGRASRRRSRWIRSSATTTRPTTS